MKTAVEWFFKQLTEVDYGCINKTFLQNNNTLAGHKLRELLDKAKEMEKEQMFNHISFGAGLKKSMEEIIYENIKKEFEELVKQGKLKDYRNYKSE